METYVTQQGDCLSSIAYRFGYASWKVLWDAPENERLRELRKDPNVLYPGDEVALPDKAPKKVKLQTNQDYEVRVTAATTRLRIRLVDGTQPIAQEKYELSYGDVTVQDMTDDDGMLEQVIPIDVTEATLALMGRGLEYQLLIGHLDPATEITGAQARLKAVSAYTGDVDGQEGQPFTDALLAFQQAEELEQTGELDDTTARALEDSYGC